MSFLAAPKARILWTIFKHVSITEAFLAEDIVRTLIFSMTWLQAIKAYNSFLIDLNLLAFTACHCMSKLATIIASYSRTIFSVVTCLATLETYVGVASRGHACLILEFVLTDC